MFVAKLLVRQDADMQLKISNSNCKLTLRLEFNFKKASERRQYIINKQENFCK